MSLDGRLTRPPDESRWITGRDARLDANRLRACVDAVLVGAETVRADNPRLTVRGVRGARQPWCVVLPAQASYHAKLTSRPTNLLRELWFINENLCCQC